MGYALNALVWACVDLKLVPEAVFTTLEVAMLYCKAARDEGRALFVRAYRLQEVFAGLVQIPAKAYAIEVIPESPGADA
jgi:hypothetical protein